MYKDIIYILLNKDNYNKYYKYIKNKITNKYVKDILNSFEEYFNTSKDTSIDINSFRQWFIFTKNISSKIEILQLYEEILDGLDTHVPKSSVEDSIIESLLSQHYGEQIADIALAVAEGDSKRSLDDIENILDTYHSQTKKIAQIDSYEVSDDITELVTALSPSSGLSWRLDCLNYSVDPLKQGDFIVIGARPDAGKTTLLASEATYMAGQLSDDNCVLWFNNEESGQKVKARILTACLQRQWADIETDPNKAKEDYVTAMNGMWDRIRVVDKSDLHIKDIEYFLDKYPASLIIIDQLWKVKGFETKSTNDVGNITNLFSRAREWAKSVAPVITVNQCDGSAEGQKWINMSQFYMAKTAIQGEADVILMLGRTNDPTEQSMRFLNIPKNKSMTVNPALKNQQWELEIYRDLAKFESLSTIHTYP